MFFDLIIGQFLPLIKPQNYNDTLLESFTTYDLTFDIQWKYSNQLYPYEAAVLL